VRRRRFFLAATIAAASSVASGAMITSVKISTIFFEFDPARTAAVVIVKHANPCGVAEGASLIEAYERGAGGAVERGLHVRVLAVAQALGQRAAERPEGLERVRSRPHRGGGHRQACQPVRRRRGREPDRGLRVTTAAVRAGSNSLTAS
jgi:hypothetical protein